MRILDDGRTVIMDSTPQLPILPDKPEPSRREPKWLTKSELKKRMKWDESDFEAAIGLPEPIQFPAAAKRILAGSWGFELRWKDTDIDRWTAKAAEHVALVQRLIQK